MKEVLFHELPEASFFRHAPVCATETVEMGVNPLLSQQAKVAEDIDVRGLKMM